MLAIIGVSLINTLPHPLRSGYAGVIQDEMKKLKDIFAIVENKAGEVPQFSKRLADSLHRIANIEAFIFYSYLGFREGKGLGGVEYFQNLMRRSGKPLFAYLLFCIKVFMLAPNEEYIPSIAEEYNHAFEEDPEGISYRIIYDGNCSIFRSILLFDSRYDEGKKKEILKDLVKLYRESDLDRPYAALVLAVYYLTQKIAGVIEYPDPEKESGDRIAAARIADRYMREAFRTIPYAVAERNRRLSVSEETMAFTGYCSDRPQLLQETNRLVNFYINMFSSEDRMEGSVCVLSPAISEEINKGPLVTICGLNPDWDSVVCVCNFHALLSEPFIIDNTEGMLKIVHILFEKNIPDRYLAMLFSFLLINESFPAMVWADIALRYIKEHNLEKQYPESTSVIEKIMVRRTGVAAFYMLPYLAQWYFKNNEAEKAFSVLRCVVENDLKRRSKTDSSPVYDVTGLESLEIHPKLKEELYPYVERLAAYQGGIRKYLALEAERYLNDPALEAPIFDCRNIEVDEQIAWTSDAEIIAAAQAMNKIGFAKSCFLCCLAERMKKEADEVYQIPNPAVKGDDDGYYRQELANRQARAEYLDGRFRAAAARYEVGLNKQIDRPEDMDDIAVSMYKTVSSEMRMLKDLVMAGEEMSGGRFLAAKANIDRVSLPAECRRSQGVNKYIKKLKERIDRIVSEYEADKKKLGEIITKADAIQSGREGDCFADIEADLAFARGLPGRYPDIYEAYPDWNSDKLISFLEKIQGDVKRGKKDALDCLGQILDDKIAAMQDWMLIRMALEEIRRIDWQTFVSFYEEAFVLLRNRYVELQEGIIKGLFNDAKPHFVMEEETYVRVNQLAFISREMYAYLKAVPGHGKIEAKVPALYRIQSASHAAFVLQKIKIARMMLTVLCEAERKHDELKGDFTDGKHIHYYAKPRPYSVMGSKKTVVLGLDKIEYLDDVRDKRKRLSKAKYVFYPGNRLVFARNKEELDEKKEGQTLPMFEVVQIDENNVTLECVNYSSFGERRMEDLINKHIAERGIFEVQCVSDAIKRRDFLNELWCDLGTQRDRFDIFMDRKEGNGKTGNKHSGKKKAVEALPSTSSFPEVQVSRSFNNDPNNLINALLGLSTGNGFRANSSHGLPAAGHSYAGLNESQNAATAFVCEAIPERDVSRLVSFIQSPGGCGKTHTSAVLCREFFSRNATICLAAPTHVAVDNMVLKFLEICQGIDVRRQIGRFGSEEGKIDPEVKKRCYDNRRDMVLDVMGQKNRGHILAHTLGGRDGDPELRKIRTEKDMPVESLNDTLLADLLIIDEASMAGIDQILVLAARVLKPGGKIVIMGDQRQLPYYGLGDKEQKKVKDMFGMTGDSRSTAVFEGIDIRADMLAEAVREVYSTSLLEDRHGRAGTHSFFFNENHRSTDVIVELLNQITYNDDGVSMVSTRSPLPDPLTEQVKMFDVPDTSNDELLRGEEGQYISIPEICSLLSQMAEDFNRISDLRAVDTVFISPYKAQVSLFEDVLIVYCFMNELKNLQESVGLSSYFDGGLSEKAARIENAIQTVYRRKIDISDFLRNRKDSRKAGALLNQLRSGRLAGWIYSRRLTLEEAIYVESQEIQDGFSADDEDYRRDNGKNGVHVSTIHKIQGKEKRAVYISLVRNNSEGAVGFLNSKLGPHMITTAVGRAKDYVRIAFNRETWRRRCNSPPRTRSQHYGKKCAEMVMKIDRFVSETLPRKEREQGRALAEAV